MHEPNITQTRRPNRLLQEKSPYLLQHAYNPVDWFPWGDEAFEKARQEDKPIFLSIGYSTCYWCHVMEREVFENETIAALMNRLVVPIKVDREERPDIDRIYMSALQAMSGSGGWPMSMFLTPDLKPFFGATYIPPTERHGRAGFPQILEKICEVWSSDRQKVLDAAETANDYLVRLTKAEGGGVDPDEGALQSAFESFQKNFDHHNAGFGGAPKFPRPVALNFLLRYHARSKNPRALDMPLETLCRMAHGGMYDHIGGGFHRYSTDDRWHVPHFEKMLYDQAQLAVSYVEAFQITRETFFRTIAIDILDYVLRDLTHPDGGFFSAEDAESALDQSDPAEKAEGAFYVWTQSEIETILTQEEARIWCRSYGVEANGNVSDDPHSVFPGKNVLHVIHTPAETAIQFSLTEERTKELLWSSRQKLRAARNGRPHCHLDDKILTSWNGMMITALAKAYQVLGDIRYLHAAEKSAAFVLSHVSSTSTGGLYHRYRDGEARIEGQLDDYAFFVQALIDLYEASFSIGWLKEALRLAEDQNRIFYDRDNGGFFDTSGNDPSILVRTKEWYDGAEPSGNAIAILNLLRLTQFTNNQEWEAMARKSLSFFGERLSNAGQAMPQMLVALDFGLSKPKQIIIAGNAGDPDTETMLHAIQSHFVPNKVLMLADAGDGQAELSRLLPIIGSLKKLEGRTTAYICENYTCQLPTSDPAEIVKILAP
ncbi:MAG: thioredoxin domain-containing protein [Ignavibacteriales bacterium]|nr:thioredoxin domain-containing protein [Ignavibacteriales bacterium]